MTLLLTGHWSTAYIEFDFTWKYLFTFKAWDPNEFIRAALSTDSFFEIWEVFAAGVNTE